MRPRCPELISGQYTPQQVWFNRHPSVQHREERPMPTPPLFTGANHICIATRDLDRAVRVWSDRYGVGPWRVFEYDASNMSAMIDGRPAQFEMRAALAQLGPSFRIEIIQPLSGDNPYADSLEQHGGADHLHHVRLEVADFEAASRRLGDMGLATRLYATF